MYEPALGGTEPATKKLTLGIPWWSSGYNSVLSLPRAWVQSLVRELKSHKPRGAAKKRKKKKKKGNTCGLLHGPKLDSII